MILSPVAISSLPLSRHALGKGRGNRWLHLGGGVGGDNDPLFAFKAGFSDTRFKNQTMRLILDEPRYREPRRRSSCCQQLLDRPTLASQRFSSRLSFELLGKNVAGTTIRDSHGRELFTLGNYPCRWRFAGLITLFVASASLAEDIATVPAKSIAVKKEPFFRMILKVPHRPNLGIVCVPQFFLLRTVFLREHRLVTSRFLQWKANRPSQRTPRCMASKSRPRIAWSNAKVRFDGATMIDVEFDDRKYTGAHYGHLCRAQVRLNGVTLIDERDGNMKNDIRAMLMDRHKKTKPEAPQRPTGRPSPPSLKPANGTRSLSKPSAMKCACPSMANRPGYLKSSGIAHETKSKIELGVAARTDSSTTSKSGMRNV